MFRRLLAVFAIALLAASCSSTDTLATVDGVEITKGDLYALNPAYEDAEAGDFSGEQLRQSVTDLIILETSRQNAAEEFGVVISDADIAERLVNPPARYAALLAADATAEGTAEIQRQRAVVSLLLDRVSPELVVADYDGWEGVLEERPDFVTKACIRHINVPTEVEARDVLARLDAGEDFVALVEEFSQDSTSQDGLLVGADGSCLMSYVSLDEGLALESATADLNVPAGPLPLGTGYSVIRVEDRVQPGSADELTADPMAYLDPDVASNYYYSWASDALREADIEVSPVLGTWSSVGFGISPPSSE